VQANLGEITGTIGGISLAALGFGAVMLLPGRLSASYEADLSDSPASSAHGGLPQNNLQKIMEKYSALNLAQSRTSFIASIVFASLGFLVILSGVAVVIFKLGTLESATIPALSGAVVETVGGLLFAINKRTQKVMLEFYNKLRSDHRVEHAIEIAKELPDRHMGSSLQVLLALQFVEAEGVVDLFRQLLDDADPHAGSATRPSGLIPQQRDRRGETEQPGS
jgi:hypothetical protein